ncbi:MAG: TetR/AcrR family transcriptional regulator, partial [Myxococcota bacterium]
MEGNQDAILKAAEEMVRQGGYNAFSFRAIADVVGIKSSSVHYYFPTKEDLGVAVAKYYTHRFIESLGEPHALI